ncbi:Stage II sporulation protein E (SpoIIE) [Bremerella volcania]|uniref:Stage II sporulation protein E (SpoIIE) n=1 Tax=Bremerella volcania TaxID=2527984 RepID=A0A518CG80_9BACT|nr:SpoIIE family protein phosphatase [Bremerella volcania]QDU78231.1 Stage II sporulation protein E (SpoIIE) [Bremerella volcania]
MTPRKLDTGSFVRTATGHFVGGDLAIVRSHDDYLFLALVDVLGHGPQAYSTALELEEVILGWKDKFDILALMKALHNHQKQGRGAVISLCTIESDSGDVRYVGIGNATCRMMGEHPHHMLTREGVVGHTLRTPTLERMTLDQHDILLLYSDGVSSHFELAEPCQLFFEPLNSVARRVVEQFGRDHDDASCIAVRYA